MCGIAGYADLKSSKEYKLSCLEKMKDRMRHRGPDDEGSFVSDDEILVMGFRRLSIIDLSKNGAQPMISHNGRYVITYNGEIYNHALIKRRLLSDASTGISETDFKGTTDTEILLEAISAYGVKEAIGMCKGMFGIALYDRQDKELYLIRDRIGEKPLYYGFFNGSFVYASDIGSIAAIDGFDNEINEDVLDIYFENGYIPAPYTIYKDIYKLKPGCILKISSPFDGECSIEPYWDMDEIAFYGQKNKFTGSFEEARDELEKRLKASIEGQMIADVPLGAFLSAGIDSTTTVALMQSVSDKKVKSFTIGMEDDEFNEAVYAKDIAKHIGTEHTELYITDKDAKEVIPKLPSIFGEPFADSSQIPTYLVAKMTKEHVTVSLSGDGGDELFCGYTSYNSVERIWNKMKNYPYFLRKPVSSLLLKSPLKNKEIIRIKSMLLGAKGPEELYIRSNAPDPLIRKIALKDTVLKSSNEQFVPDYLGEVNHDIMLMNMKMYHPDDILVKVDRTAMAVSLETRVPMLDRDVVEFAWTLPIEYLVYDEYNGWKREGKRILKELLYKYVPKELMSRPKKGFSIPIEKWLKDGELREWAEELLDRKTIEKQAILNPDTVEFMWKDFVENGIWRDQIWYILVFQQWLRDNGL